MHEFPKAALTKNHQKKKKKTTHKESQTGSIKQQKLLAPWVWRLEVWDPSISSVGSFWRLWERIAPDLSPGLWPSLYPGLIDGVLPVASHCPRSVSISVCVSISVSKFTLFLRTPVILDSSSPWWFHLNLMIWRSWASQGVLVVKNCLGMQETWGSWVDPWSAELDITEVTQHTCTGPGV